MSISTLNLSLSDVTEQINEAFSSPNLLPRKCTAAINSLLLLRTKISVPPTSLKKISMTILRGFQSRDLYLKSMLYLGIEDTKDSPDSILAVNTLAKASSDQNISQPLCLRALFSVVPPEMIHDYEEIIFRASISKNSISANLIYANSILYDLFHLGLVSRVRDIPQGDSRINLAINFENSGITSRLLSRPLVGLEGVFLAKIHHYSSLLENRDHFPFIDSKFEPSVLIETIRLFFTRPTDNIIGSVDAAISSLRPLIRSRHVVTRFAAMRLIADVAKRFPRQCAAANNEIEDLIDDKVRAIASMATSVILITGSDCNTSRLVSKIGSSFSNLSDREKNLIFDSLNVLCVKYPSRGSDLIHLYKRGLEEKADLQFKTNLVRKIKKLIHETSINTNIDKKNSDMKKNCGGAKKDNRDCKDNDFKGNNCDIKGNNSDIKGNNCDIKGNYTNNDSKTNLRDEFIAMLATYIEDSQHFSITIEILGILGTEIPHCSNPDRFVLPVLNRMILENNHVRLAALQCIACFSGHVRHDMAGLVKKYISDDDEMISGMASFLARSNEICGDEVVNDDLDNFRDDLGEYFKSPEKSKIGSEISISGNESDIKVTITKIMIGDEVMIKVKIINKEIGIIVKNGVIKIVSGDDQWVYNYENLKYNGEIKLGLGGDTTFNVPKVFNGVISYKICSENDLSDVETETHNLIPFEITSIDFFENREINFNPEFVKTISFFYDGSVGSASQRVTEILNLKIVEQSSENGVKKLFVGCKNKVGVRVVCIVSNESEITLDISSNEEWAVDMISELFE